MSSPFVTGDRFPVSVKFFMKKLKNGLSSIVVVRTEEDEKIAKANGAQIEEINTQWQQANWKQSHELIRASTVWDAQAGERAMDYQKYRYLLLENQMVAWDVKDDKGQIVPLSKEVIGTLAPAVASALVDGYMSATTMTEKEMGE